MTVAAFARLATLRAVSILGIEEKAFLREYERQAHAGKHHLDGRYAKHTPTVRRGGRPRSPRGTRRPENPVREERRV